MSAFVLNQVGTPLAKYLSWSDIDGEYNRSNAMTELALSDKAPVNVVATPAWRLFGVIIGATMIGQLWFALMRQINWDEYYFLSRIHEYARGDLQDVLQTFHVHLFYWLTLISGSEVDQIVAARLVMLGLEAGTLVTIFLIARQFTSAGAALFAVAAYATSSNVIVHGASFRFDPIVTFLLMSALALLILSRMRWHHAAAAGVLVALAGLVTIKSVFFLPIVVAAALWRLSESAERRATFRALACGGTISGATFLGLHFLHAASMRGKSSAIQAEAFLSHSMTTMLNVDELSTKWVFLAQSMLLNVMLWAGIIVGIAVCVGRLHRTSDRKVSWVLLAFAFPLLTLLFYRNSFPYYYVFALAPAAIFVAVAVDALNCSDGRMQRVSLLICALAIVHFHSFHVDQSAQRATVKAVHEVFPEPVTYIDQYSMIGSFPKVGFFMSSWGMETYLASQIPSFPTLLLSEQPVFVLANSSVLINAMERTVFEKAHTLLPRELNALRSNYIHHWGAIWVAGKTFDPATPVPQHFQIAVAADYTVEASGDVSIDGRNLAPGAVLHLSQGPHTLQTVDGRFRVVLRWGDHLPVPDSPAPTREIFNGF